MGPTIQMVSDKLSITEQGTELNWGTVWQHSMRRRFCEALKNKGVNQTVNVMPLWKFPGADKAQLA